MKHTVKLSNGKTTEWDDAEESWESLTGMLARLDITAERPVVEKTVEQEDPHE